MRRPSVKREFYARYAAESMGFECWTGICPNYTRAGLSGLCWGLIKVMVVGVLGVGVGFGLVIIFVCFY